MKMNHGANPDPVSPAFSPVGAVLSSRRVRSGLQAKELANRAQIPMRRLEELEAGRAQPTPAELARLARSLGMTPSRILGEADLTEKVWSLPDEPAFDSALAALSSAADLQRAFVDHIRAAMLPDARPCAREAEAERLLAEDSWKRLEPLSPEARKASIGGDSLLAYPHFMRWGLAERLCAECEERLPESPHEALGLAELALHVAERIGGDPAWKRHLKGYTWAFIARAKLAGGDRPGADEAVAKGRELWNPACLEEPDLLAWPETAEMGGR